MRMHRLFVRQQHFIRVCVHVFRVVWLLCGLFGWLVSWWVFWRFVWLSVSLCGCGFGLFASQCGFYVVCVLGIFCWLTWGRVYRAGPSRAQI